ncbi:MAG: hypothetical protein PVH55_01680 [Desulfobacterales bacterium]|jgi:hypothetical protein
MKKIELIGMVVISLLLFGTSVRANLWSSRNDFTPKLPKQKFLGLGLVQQGNVQTAIDQGFVFPNSSIKSFSSTDNVDEYITIYAAEPSVFQRDFHFDSKIKSMSAISPSPEQPSPEPLSAEPPLPESPSPQPTLPGT